MFPVDSKILIVDDSNFARSMLKQGLTHLKYWKILEAADVKAARAFLMEEGQSKDPVHLVLTDLTMPEITGLEFLRWIRSQDRIKTMPVIMVTTSQEKLDILEAGRAGISQFMIKPFDHNTLRDKLLSTWNKHGKNYYESTKVT
jgi:two-component system chemotaxis response regulator CheY